ncbi:MAG: hypothetical protein EAX81_00065 [Candidatus Thorarchaeota archaeon]|nr:hypothetical protein [Candidatus Thorarchaeota archaeon]
MKLRRESLIRTISLGLILLIAIPSGILLLSDRLPFDTPRSPIGTNRMSGDVYHASIFIDSDDVFVTLGIPGDGSSDDPYRIENYLIDGTAADHCIYITGTTVHFTIKNCTLRGIAASGKSGIYLDSTEKALIMNNTAFNCSAGLVLYYADNNTIKDNSLYENEIGISVTWGENNTIENNNCSYNVNDGIQLSHGHRNRLRNNLLLMNEEHDIYGWRSNYNNVSDNTMGGGDWKAGIFWYDSDYCRIEDNLVQDCINGMDIYFCDYFEVINNTVKRCNIGIWVSSYSYHNLVFDNFCTEDNTGILISNNSGNEVYDNNCTNNQVGVAIIDSASSIQVYQNELRNCTKGVSLTWNARHNNVSDNYCIDNDFGVFVAGDAHHNNVEFNTCMNNTQGISLGDTTHNNTIVNNLCDAESISESKGVVINDEAADNYISHNNCTRNMFGIVVSETIHENTVSDNFILNCETGVYLNATERARIEINFFEYFDFGIEINAKTNMSIVRWNTFLEYSGAIDAWDDGTANIFDYNFWWDYAGVDGDSDGIGDTPYAISGTASNEDPHPVVHHPTRPVWNQPLEDQSGEAGYPFSYDLNATAAAPIDSWGIDDTVHFAIDGDGVITNAIPLSISDYEVNVWVQTIYGVNLTGTFTVMVLDTIAPTVDHPADITFPEYPEDEALSEITWNISDKTNLDVRICIEGSEEFWDEWSPGDGPYTRRFDFLGMGTFNITLLLTDEGGNTATDTVMVTVTEQMTTTTTTTTTTREPVDIMTYALIIGSWAVIIVIIVVIAKRRRA